MSYAEFSNMSTGELFLTFVVSLAVTVLLYCTVPVVLRLTLIKKDKIEYKRITRIAVINSIVVWVIFLFINSENVSTFYPPILYFFINRWIMRAGYRKYHVAENIMENIGDEEGNNGKIVDSVAEHDPVHKDVGEVQGTIAETTKESDAEAIEESEYIEQYIENNVNTKATDTDVVIEAEQNQEPIVHCKSEEDITTTNEAFETVYNKYQLDLNIISKRIDDLDAYLTIVGTHMFALGAYVAAKEHSLGMQFSEFGSYMKEKVYDNCKQNDIYKLALQALGYELEGHDKELIDNFILKTINNWKATSGDSYKNEKNQYNCFKQMYDIGHAFGNKTVS